MIVQTNWYVICFPQSRTAGEATELEALSLLKKIAERCTISDGLVVSDWVCSFCGLRWMTKESERPTCCVEAEKEWELAADAEE